MSIRGLWDARVRAGEQKSAQESTAARQKGVSAVRGLQDLTDEELIAQSPARSSLSVAHHEMEMQRRLKESIKALTDETARARRWAFWGAVAIGALTLVLVALTIVIVLKA